MRRLNLMKTIMLGSHGRKHEHLVIIPSSPKVFMTNDIPYPFRQNTDFLFFCGFQEPDSVLVLTANHNTMPMYKSILFVPKKIPAKELWDGPRSGRDGAIELTGVDEAYNYEDLESYLFKYLTRTEDFVLWYDYVQPVHQVLHVNILGRFLNQKKHVSLERLQKYFHGIRSIKSVDEIELLKTSADIASQAFVEVMKSTYPSVSMVTIVLLS